ncbi:MAG: glycosyltransferase [Eudoraea sp.]
MKEPLISILIPFKNTASYLVACLDSILRQSYTNWEILAVDDHSSDNSRAILSNYTYSDSRIHLETNMGSGIIWALRTALEMSKGTMITRMDSDDIMLPDKLYCLAKPLALQGRGHIAISGVKYFSEFGISNGYERYENWLNTLTAKGTNYSELYKECVVPSPAWLVYREDLDASGSFDGDQYPEDYDLTFRFYKLGLKIIPCNVKLHLWRDYPTRTSRTSEHYAQNYFLDLKLHYFLAMHYNINRPLCLWGAGQKGKKLAKELLLRNIDFFWLCDNPKKIGKKIYDIPLEHYEKLKQINKPQSIITVANDNSQKEIKSFLSSLESKSMLDYFFFC